MGLGVERRVADMRLVGHALTLDGEISQAASFTRGPETDIAFVTLPLTKHRIYDIMSDEWCNELPAFAIHPSHQPACPTTLLSG